MKKLLPLFITLSLSGLSYSANAEDLLQVYQNAKESNPTLRKAAADRDAAYKGIDIARSPLLPQLGLSGSYGLTQGFRDANNNNRKFGDISLGVSQTLFNMNTWRQLNITEKQAGVQELAYQAQQQALILNTSVAYFNVLSALDTLSFIEARKEAIYRQLDQTRQRFKVGLLPVTDVQNAQAQYDQTLADEVGARNNLDNVLEDLRQVSGQFYAELSALNAEQFTTQKPGDVNSLLRQAEERNLDLLTARLAQDISRETIRLAQTGYMPTLSLNASSSLSKNEAYGSQVGDLQQGNSINGQNSASVNVNLPLYSGGQTSASVKQAQYNFIGASETLESTNRAMVKNLRSSHNNISAAISSISAYKQAVISAQSSLDATQAGYSVGTRTIVDVLNATTTLYDAKQKLATARYSYLVSLLTLKSAIGTLNEEDVHLLNSALGKSITTSPAIKSLG